MSVKGIALVTGSGQGIGRGVALRLADDGFDVAINDIASKKDVIDSVVTEIQRKGRRSLAVPADVGLDGEVKEMVATVVKELGGLDVMVANAGICQYQPFLETSVEQWDRTMAINARGVFLCYKYAAEQMIKQGRPGRIIGASSVAGKKGMPMCSDYCASKFAVRGLTQSAATELGKYGITVNAYAPGAIDTPLLQFANESISNITGTPSDLLTTWKGMAVTDKHGYPEDIAGFVSYLASAQSHFLTGQTINIDGGVYFD
ncbi:NAD(P)-binding protein [Gautieria morchelliformis]|nr:NAD(P)-binding protein [Gautieria morchelliformis]